MIRRVFTHIHNSYQRYGHNGGSALHARNDHAIRISGESEPNGIIFWLDKRSIISRKDNMSSYMGKVSRFTWKKAYYIDEPGSFDYTYTFIWLCNIFMVNNTNTVSNRIIYLTRSNCSNMYERGMHRKRIIKRYVIFSAWEKFRIKCRLCYRRFSCPTELD